MKNNFKKSIQDRYKGRGNCWVKVNKDSIVYTQILNYLSSLNENTSDYTNHINREGFAWLRFSKVTGTPSHPFCNFEVRFKGSKIDHPENIISVAEHDAIKLDLLGNTPHKLQLEMNANEKTTSIKKERSIVTKTNVKNDDTEIVAEQVKQIKEISLTKPSNRELENWYNFLRVNNMYEEHA